MKYLFLCLLALVGCGRDSTYEDRRTNSTSESQDFQELKKTVLALQGTIAMINAFTAKDFTDCGNALPPFEQKVCTIAQTAVAEGQLEYFSSLAEMVKVFQDQLYGPDCTNTTDTGCPVASSITSDIAALQAASGQNDTAIAALEADVTSLQAGVAAINTRLNNFNGTGTSIEIVVNGINATLVMLDNRLDSIEANVGDGDSWKTIRACFDNPASGPVFEAFLRSGDKLELVGYVQAGISSSSPRGLGVIATAGVSGTQYLTTSLNTAACKYKVYDVTTELKVCWHKTNRSATTAQIDTACLPGYSGVACTCK